MDREKNYTKIEADPLIVLVGKHRAISVFGAVFNITS